MSVPTCACAAAAIGFCSQAEACQCTDATPSVLSCSCAAA
jgi:hypothetical protein